MCGCWGGGCVKVASGRGDNGTAGLVITMGHGEGREQAGSVNEVRMGARERSYLVKFMPETRGSQKNNIAYLCRKVIRTKKI